VKSGELSLSFTAYRINQHREYSPLGSTRDLAQSYGNSDNDTRHVAVINYIWELPLGRGKGYLSNGVVGKIMEGFELGGIFTAQTGHPFQVRGTGHAENGYHRLGLPIRRSVRFGDRLRAYPSAGIWLCILQQRVPIHQSPYGLTSNNERNHWYGPGFWDWDVTLAKRMSLNERVKAELRFEGYNIRNRPHFLNPGTDSAGIGNLIGQGQFGVITATSTQPDGTTSARQIQVALKIVF